MKLSPLYQKLMKFTINIVCNSLDETLERLKLVQLQLKKVWGILPLFFSLFIISCTMSSEIYLPGRTWTFVSSINGNKTTDTLVLNIKDESWQIFQRLIEYTYHFSFSKDGSNLQISLNEETGVIDRHNSLFFDNEIWLHPPRALYLRYTELLPFPNVFYPINIGDKRDWNLKLKAGWGNWEGLEVEGESILESKVLLENEIIKDSCYLIKTHSKTKVGTFEAEYVFSEKYGFVDFKYFIPDSVIHLKLVKTNF